MRELMKLTKDETREEQADEFCELMPEEDATPSPDEVRHEDVIVLPEIQSMTEYIRKHYERTLLEDAGHRIETGGLSVRHEGRVYRAGSGANGMIVNLHPLSGAISWMSFHRENWCYVRADLELSMCVRIDYNGEYIESPQKYYVALWLDMENGISVEHGAFSLFKSQTDYLGIRLDEYLIPIYGMEDIETEAESILEEYLGDTPRNIELIQSELLAQRMGLNIVYLPLFNRPQTASILFFEPGELLVSNPGENKNDATPIAVTVDRNTIVVNDSIIKPGKDPVFHECFHYAEHQLFFRLQKLHNSDISALAKWKELTLEKEARSPVEWMEWQARYGSQCLQLPRTKLKARVNKELEAMQDNGEHMGQKLHLIGRKLAREYGVYNYILRNRMVQIGFRAAKGALNFVDHGYIDPFAFSLGECHGNQSFVISAKEMLAEYVRNEAFRDIINTGRYIYVDGHVCLNLPEYVVLRDGKLCLSTWANAHVDQCCLRFVRNYYRVKQTQYIYGQLNSDEEYNGRSLTLSAGELAPEFYAHAIETSQMLMSLPGNFHETFARLMDINKTTVEELAERTGISERSIIRYRTEERYDYSIDTIAILCIGLHLDPLISHDLLKKAGILLRNTPEDLMINAVLMGMYRYSVEEVANFLRESNYPRSKNWPDFDY